MPTSPELKQVGPVDPVRRLDRIADPRQEAFARTVRPLLGQTLQGDVLSRLGDNDYLVRIAGTPTRVQLPSATAPGTALPMTLVALSPRPTFDIGRAASGASILVSADAGLQAPALGSALSGAGADGSQLLLSDTAKLLTAVLDAAAGNEASRTAVIARIPLLAGPDAPPQQLATALRNAIATSGLFYESHVADWAQGERTLAELDAEPQQQAAREGVRQLPTDPATAQFINLQLSTQEQSQVGWQGQLWPGQALELEVRRDAQGHQAADDAGMTWHSRLRLRFPGLGELDATLSLGAHGLQVRIETGSESCAQALRKAMPTLAMALEAAGTPLTGFDARADGHDD